MTTGGLMSGMGSTPRRQYEKSPSVTHKATTLVANHRGFGWKFGSSHGVPQEEMAVASEWKVRPGLRQLAGIERKGRPVHAQGGSDRAPAPGHSSDGLRQQPAARSAPPP